VLWSLPTFAAPAAPAARPSNSAEQMLYDAVNRERSSLGLRQLQWDTRSVLTPPVYTPLFWPRTMRSRIASTAKPTCRHACAWPAPASAWLPRMSRKPLTFRRCTLPWMNSAQHRANILDPQVDSIGIAIERRGEQYYATQDFAAVVAPLSREEQEQQIARLLQANGLSIVPGVDDARRNCDQNRSAFGAQPVTIARFETSDLKPPSK